MSKREPLATAVTPASSDFAPTKRAGWRGLLGAPLLIAAVALFIVAVDNDPFWQGAWRATQNDEHRLAILSTLFALIFVPLTVADVDRGRHEIAARGRSAVAARCGQLRLLHDQYGVVIDQSMIRNAVETTALEATPLLSGAYFRHVLLYGVLPAIVVFAVPLKRLRWPTELFVRFGTAAIAVAALATTMYVNYSAASFFARDNDGLRLQINPAYPLWAAATLGASRDG